jgi:predicted amidohydrolase YtcJ
MASRLTTFIVATIVAGTLIAGLIVGAQRDDATGPVDLIITNGQVYRGAGTQFAEAVAVRGNKVLVVGSNREVKRLRRPRTTMVDAHGGTVLPGFNDAHVHLLDGGRMLTAVDLFGASTLADVEAALKAYAALHADEPWIRGRRWTYQPLPGSVLARQRIDAIVPDRPALVTAAENHAGWANTRALQAAGITRRTPNPPDGVIVKDPRTGDPTGVLKGGALRLVERVLPEPTHEERRTALRTAAAEAHSVGITSVQHVAGDVDDLEAVAALRTAGELDLRVYAGLAVAPGFTEADAEVLDAARTSYPDDPLFKAGAVAVTVGAVETGPFAGRARRVPTYTAEELTSLVRLLDARGWQILVRTHDRHGVRMALDAFEQAMGATPTPERGRRHRLEHVTGIDDADVDRLVQMGIVAAQRPTPGGLGAGDLDAWAARGATSRDAAGALHQRIRDGGGRVVFGSGWPMAILDPLVGLQVATAATAEEDGAATPGARLDALAAAVDAYTTQGAWAAFDEQRKGRLERDMLADIVILSTDIFTPGRNLRDAFVHTTIFDGRVVYRRPAPETTD